MKKNANSSKLIAQYTVKLIREKFFGTKASLFLFFLVLGISNSFGQLQVPDFSGNSICRGAGTGQLKISATGGVAPFTVIYNDGIANRTVAGVNSGIAFNAFANPVNTSNYNLVSVTDANGQVRSLGFIDGIATITVNPVPVATASASVMSLCSGQSSFLSSTGSSPVINTVSFFNNTAGIIPDNSLAGITRPIIVSGLPLSMASLSGISVTLNITHPNADDVEVYLVRPGGELSTTGSGKKIKIIYGSSICLFANNGKKGSNLTSTVFSDAGVMPVESGKPPYTATYRPKNPFSTLAGDPNGTWKLLVVDVTSGIIGTLENWSIKFSYGNEVSFAWTSTPAGFTSTMQNPGNVFPTVSTTYNLTVTDAGTNCTAQAIVPITVSQPPTVAIAGSPKTIVAGTQLTLAANTPVVGNGAWSVISGPATGIGQLSNINDPAAVFTPAGGTGTYILGWTISNSPCTASTSSVTITVENAVADGRILIDLGDAYLTTIPDASGKYWNNMISARPGIQVQDAVTTANMPTTVDLEVVNRIDGTFNEPENGLFFNDPAVIAVGDYPSSATTDYAFADPSTTTGQWKFTGLNSQREYSIKFWGSKTADNRIIQIKRSDETTWQEYDAAFNTDYNRAAVFTFNGKTEMSFDIRVKDGSPFGYINVVDINSTSIVSPVQLPVARAGNDSLITLPTNSVVLDGSNSTAANGSALKYLWTYLPGPGNPGIADPASAQTSVNSLTEGLYSFVLTVTDNNNAVDTDTVRVIVANRILIDMGDAFLTTAPDAGGKYWNNMITAVPGVQVQNAITTSNVPTTVNLEVVNRIDGTFNPGENGMFANDPALAAVGDYPSTTTTDYAFADVSTTEGSWKFTGLDATKKYTIKFWGSRSFDNRFIEIKRSDETTWKEYDAAFNTDYNRAAVFTFNGKTEMSFDIRVKDGSSFGYINIVDITIISPVSIDPPLFPLISNNPPGRVIRPDISIYPNPAHGHFKILVKSPHKNKPVTVQIVNGSGRLVYQGTLKTNNGVIDMNIPDKLTGGIYWINCIVNGETIIKKLFIKK